MPPMRELSVWSARLKTYRVVTGSGMVAQVGGIVRVKPANSLASLEV